MPPRSLSAVKAIVDAELRTPVVVWTMLAFDEMRHHPHESAEFNATFNGHPYKFLSGCQRSGDGMVWHIAEVQGPNISARQGIVSDAETWADARTAFAVAWETVCESERDREALRRWSADVIDEPDQSQDTRITRLGITLGAWILRPAFTEDTRDYAAIAHADTIRLEATAKFPAQAFAWADDSTTGTGTAFTFVVPGGATGVTLNTVRLTVTAEDGDNTDTYTILITR